MKVVFLGVGEACDERLPNTSVLVEGGEGSRRSSVLLDCGFTVPPIYFRRAIHPDALDVLWISHFHGDHFFGVPILLLRLWETGRSVPLTIAGPPGIEDLIQRAMTLAYPNFLRKLAFALRFVEADPQEALSMAGFTWRFAENGHGQRDLAVRLDDGSRSLFYSGDGRPTPETLELARGCSLIVHEAFHLDESIPGHGTVAGCVDFARRARAGALALVHLQRDVRRDRRDSIDALIRSAEGFRVFLPEPGDEMDL